jgi:hypothetical protein
MAMDVEQLHVILQQSFSADASIRKPAEEQIKNLKNLSGSVVLLLQVAAEKQVSLSFLGMREQDYKTHSKVALPFFNLFNENR